MGQFLVFAPKLSEIVDINFMASKDLNLEVNKIG